MEQTTDILDLFHAAVDLPPDEQLAFAREHCGDDRELCSKLERMLRLDRDRTGVFMRSPGDILNAEDLVGQVIDAKYHVLSLLGEGGMGLVYLAQQTAPIHRQVAIKVVKLGMDTKQVIARFDAERQALAIMEHPSIAKVLDAGATTSGRPYFVMELVKGVPVTEYCNENRLSTRDRLELFLSICDAVQHAHHKGVIHRDLKPSNVIVTVETGTPLPKVIDFGIAKATAQHPTDRTSLTEQGQLIGTPEYMSPEQAKMNELDVDTRTDVYSLGALLYELLTGAKPFDSQAFRIASPVEIQRMVCDTDPPKPSTRVTLLAETPHTGTSADDRDDNVTMSASGRQGMAPSLLIRELRGDLDWIVMRAMDKDRDRRYATVAGFAADVRRHLANQPVDAGPPSTVYRMRKFVRRNTGLVTSGTVVALSLVAIGVVSSTLAVAQSKERARAQTAASRADAVKLFLERMLTSAREAGSRGRDVTMREVLEATTIRLDAGELAAQPLVEEEVRGIIGETYRDLGIAPLAVPHLRWQYQAVRARLGDSHIDTLGVLWAYGEALKESGRPEALETVTRFYETARQALGPEHEMTISAMDSMANALMRIGRAAEALPLQQQSYEGMRRIYGDGHTRTALALFNLAGTMRSLGQLQEAEGYYKQALGVFEREVGPYSDSGLRIQRELAAHVYRPLGRQLEAEALLRNTLVLVREGLGEEHIEYAAILQNLAPVLRDLRKFDESRAILSEASELSRRIFGEHSHQFARALHHEAENLLIGGDPASAAETLAQVVDVEITGRPDIAGLCNQALALALCELGRFQEAEVHAREAVALWRLAPAQRFEFVQNAECMLDLVEIELGRVAEVERRLLERLALFEARGGVGRTLDALAMALLGRCLAVIGDDDQAESLLRRANEAVGQGVPPNVQAHVIRRLLIEFLDSHGRDDEAARWRST